uniref:Mucolipin-3-like n=1 Tax=Salarias fasciatus TaxID=181472 RepID=A0A672HLB7_SALFA
MEDSSDPHDVYGIHEASPWADSQSQQDDEDRDKVDSLRRKIKYYFMNPCEKYHARGRKPWKLILQIVKIAFITIQLVSFGLSNQMVVTFKEENLMTFKHLFLKDYVDGGMDTYALYRQSDTYDHIYHIITQVSGFCKNSKNKWITFNNGAHSGRIKVDLETDVDINECRDWKVSGASAKSIYLTVLFDCLIVVMCITSFTLCTRSIINGILLQHEYTSYYRKRCGKHVPWLDKLEFVNGWYILIIVSDTLTIIGSILKMEIQTKVVTNYDVCSIFLGVGTMFVWIGVIRYMGYFRKYNILILTLRAAFPNVIRFICCAGIIYLSYCFCGWIVLGPFHEKFRTLNTVSECLFSLINGDDMFPTFVNMKQKSSLVWIFSRVYLYTFVSLFIYMILSLFITIITDTYDTIKQQQQSGVPTSELQKFLSVCNDLPNSGVYRLDKSNHSFLDCCLRR